MAALRFLTQLLALAAVLLAAAHAHDHAHEEPTDADVPASPFESSVLYDLQAGSYALKLCATSADVATEDGGMIFALLPVASSSDSDASSAATHATEIFTAFASDVVVHETVKSSTTLTLQTSNASAPDVLYRAVFSADQLCVEAALPVAAAGVVMVFAEHGADEVSVELLDAISTQPVAVLKCYSGCEDDAEAAGDEDTPSNSWWGPIGASLLISLTSFVGVIVLGLSQRRIDSVVEYMTSFAAGCLLGVVVFHLYPEGSEYLNDMGEWVMGVWVLGGITFSMAIESGVHMVLSAFGADHHHAHGNDTHDHHHHNVQPTPDAAEKGLGPVSLQAGPEYIAHPTTPNESTSVATSDAKPPQTFTETYLSSLKYVEPVAWITAVGDFFHAFTDGVVLAVAFKSCSASLGWAVALGVVLHEVPHRVGDFFIYIKAGMRVAQALVLNFFASLASLFGAVILLAAGSVSNHALGYLMGFGTGALAFIGLSVLLPPMLAVRDRRRAALHFFWFSLGCVLIGLSVLQDKHCEAAHGGAESGHSH